MKIAFLDFEFGQVYGSWRRDYLPTEVGILIYDTQTGIVKMTEKLYSPDAYLVLRKSVGLGKKRKTKTKVVNLSTQEDLPFDKSFKIEKKKQKEIRKSTKKLYYSEMRNHLNSVLQHCDALCVFGGSEDINILNKYCVKIPVVIDIQTKLAPIIPYHRKQISLDRMCHLLQVDLTVTDDKIYSCGNHCQLPKKTKAYKYNIAHINPHNAIGDTMSLFLVYLELFIKKEEDYFSLKYFSDIN